MNSDQRLPAILSLVLIMATATLGWMSLRSGGVASLGEFQGSGQVPADEHHAVARLWEDPLQAIQAEITKNKPSSGDQSLVNLQESFAQKIKDCRTAVLIVPIPETPFPGDLEIRLRSRYAIQMALADQDYAPKDRNYLGYFTIPLNPKPAASDDPSPSPPRGVTVPFEWFTQRSGSAAIRDPCAALVLWLPESFLRPDPVERLANLSRVLVPSDAGQFAGLFVIGPRSSDTLMALARANLRHDVGALRDKLAIFSPQATAADQFIGVAPATPARENLAIAMERAFRDPTQLDGSPWRYFHNFIATDDQLTDLLVSELHLRGVKLGTPASVPLSDRILILAEADTSYGRALPLAFAQSLQRHREKFGSGSDAPAHSSDPGQAQTIDSLDPQLFIYRYLRGLDQQKGQQTSEKSSNRPVAKSPEEVLAEVLSKKGAPALGESQLDYVDRIAADLDHWEKDPRTGSLRAVGVLGGDVYDKLILLRTLRAKYPNAIFFTTDLDARMWHPDHIPFTRNLIVASGYGVDARPVSRNTTDLRMRIPPFRDVYQVAVFNACRAALMKAADRETVIAPDLTPAIFELGRNGPAQLLPGGPIGSVAATIGNAVFNFGVPRFSSGQGIGIILTVIGFAATWVALRKWFVKAVDPRPFFTASYNYIGFVVIGSIVLLLWAYSSMQYIAAQPGSEPWIAHEGISIWPTEMIRLFVTIAVIITVVCARNHRDRLRIHLGSTYFPGTSHDHNSGTQIRDDSSGLHPNSALAAYSKYLAAAASNRRFIRVTWLSAAYMLLGFGAMFLVEGELPFLGHIRGSAARRLDFLIMAASIFSYIWLLFYVLDSAWITSRLLLALSQHDTIWPSALLQKMRAQFGVTDADLAGYLDVQFAAEKSREVGRLIIFPFAMQLLFIVSRSTYFDHWTWPGALIGIFLCNVVLAWAAWAILRRSARKIRKDAEKKIQSEIDALNLGISRACAVPNDHDSATNEGASTSQRQRLRRLLFLRKKVELEQRGAYSKAFQDPALIATVLPTGIFGILAVLFRAFFA